MKRYVIFLLVIFLLSSGVPVFGGTRDFPARVIVAGENVVLYVARFRIMTLPKENGSMSDLCAFKDEINSLWRRGFHLRYIKLARDGIRYQDRCILKVQKSWVLYHKSESKWLVLRWGNNLYKALSVLQAGYSRGGRYYRQVGLASWYGYRWTGRRTSSGERFNHMELTAASRTLPFNSVVMVTNLSNYKSVIVRITDRGPYYKRRIIDLSEAAAYLIGMLHSGVKRVKVEVILWNDRVGGKR